MASRASIAVAGVYRVPVDENELREQLRRYYFFGNATRDVSSAVYKFIETCMPLSLFEVTLDDLDEQFEMGGFTQGMPDAPQKAWQRAYDQAILSPDGASIIARKTTCTRGLQAGRVAFYFHYYDPSKPMLWSYGEFSSPPVQIIPQRLWDLVPYFPVG